MMTSRTRLRLLIAAVSTMLFLPAQAAWLDDVPQTLTQPDGTIIHCFATGDEFYHRLHDAGDYTIVMDPDTGCFVYAREENGEVVPTPNVAGQADPSELNLEPGARISAERYRERRAFFKEEEKERAERTPHFGEFNQIVVFVRFLDDEEFNAGESLYDGRLNDASEGAVSLYNYYMEVSRGRLQVYSHIMPVPQGGMIVSYQDPINTRDYYRPKSSSNTIGYKDDTQRKKREDKLIKNAVEYVKELGQISPDLVVDADGDGRVDNLNLIVRGNAEGWSELLWPHRWSMSKEDVYINGAKVDDYNFNLENYAQVDTLVHEFFHSLGAPDLYRYYDNTIDPVYRWDVMCNTRYPPQHPLAYMKRTYGGWLDEIPEITAPGIYTLGTHDSTSNCAYSIPSPHNDKEHFIVEYRKKVGTFERSLPGTGLIIYRINTLAEGTGNAGGPPDEVYIYRPGGTLTTSGASFMAAFSSDAGRTALNDFTGTAAASTTSFLSDASPGGLEIAQIGPAGDTISFELGSTDICWVGCSAGATPGAGTFPLDVQFFGQDHVYDCEGPIAYSWDFGDGSFGAGETVGHTYSQAGTYTWTMTLSSGGKTATAGGRIEVAEPCSLECAASAAPSRGNAPLIVDFQHAATPTNCILEPTCLWDFGDGTTSPEENPSHEYTERGTYDWRLTIQVEGITCTRQGTVEVWPAIPGDCDDSGSVSIGEVQQGINMFLDSQPAACGVDVNSDGTVSIGEVQQVINAFLG